MSNDFQKKMTMELVRLKHLIKIASSEDDVVLDSFMGVGSIGVASLEMNRRFIGSEIEKNTSKPQKKIAKYSAITIFRRSRFTR
ncbi:MAG: DNA methyltransferase [Planctomycetota bacterium]